ncbi:MAG: hypothetical protein R2697_16595 [Ilumatobacteraceae bacterium]
MRWWKILGLAGLIGGVAVAATVGARHVQQRSQREIVDGDIAEISARLHARFAEVAPSDATESVSA